LPRSLALGLAAATVSGCGFFLTHGPPDNYQQLDSFSCTESQAGPILDIVWAGLNLVGAAVIASDPNAFEEAYGSDAAPAIVGGITWGVISSSAAIVGFKKIENCNAAKAETRQRFFAQLQPPPNTAMTVAKVVITPAVDTIAVGDSGVQLMAAAYQASGTLIAGRMFNWSSSNDAIASVSNTGLVTGHAVGEAVVAANTANVVGIARIVVTERR
jgi:hypothetical protein